VAYLLSFTSLLFFKALGAMIMQLSSEESQETLSSSHFLAGGFFYG